MKSKLTSLARGGLLALGLIAGLTSVSQAGPAAPLPLDAPATIIKVKEGRHTGETECQVRGACFDQNEVRRRNDERRERRDFRRDDGDFRRGGDDDNGWRHRRDYRHLDEGRTNPYRHRRGDYRGYREPTVYFNFGSSDDYDYDYVEPRRYIEPPRRTYRGVSRAHINWCKDRYRSYRAYDNSFQPNNGPRKQCYSPYS